LDERSGREICAAFADVKPPPEEPDKALLHPEDGLSGGHPALL